MSRPARADRHVRAAAFAAATLVAHQVAGKAVRDALFLSSFDVRMLPAMMMIGSILAMGSVGLLSRALPGRGPARVVPAALALSAGLLIGEWALSVRLPRAAAVAVYLHLAVFGAPLVSGFWSLVNESFDPYTARQAMGRIGTGASLGGVLGGALAWAATGWVPVPALLLALAGANVAALLATRRLALAAPRSAPPASTGATGPMAALAMLRGNAHLRHLAVFVAAGAVIEALLDYAMSVEAVARFGGPGELAGFFALFHTAVGLVALAAQGGLAARSLESLGLAGTAALQPAAVVVTAVTGAFFPRLATVVAARGSEAVLHNSLYRSAYELLFTPLPEATKRAAKSVVDVGADKLGSVLGAGAALAVVASVPGAGHEAALGLAALLGLASLLVARRLHQGYVEALAQSLRSGAVRLNAPEVRDSTTRLALASATATIERETLLRQLRELRGAGGGAAGAEADTLLAQIRALRDPDPHVARRALARADLRDPRLAAHAVPLLARDETFLDALRGLRRAAPHVTGQILDALLDTTRSVELRRRLARVLKGCPTQRAADGLVLALADGAFDVRYEAGRALTRITDRAPELRMDEVAAFRAVRLELTEWPGRPEQQPRRLELVFEILGLVLDRESLRIAHWALSSEHPLRGTALEYLQNVLPPELQGPLWSALGMPAPASGRSLGELRAALERLHEAHAAGRRPGRRPG